MPQAKTGLRRVFIREQADDILRETLASELTTSTGLIYYRSPQATVYEFEVLLARIQDLSRRARGAKPILNTNAELSGSDALHMYRLSMTTLLARSLGWTAPERQFKMVKLVDTVEELGSTEGLASIFLSNLEPSASTDLGALAPQLVSRWEAVGWSEHPSSTLEHTVIAESLADLVSIRSEILVSGELSPSAQGWRSYAQGRAARYGSVANCKAWARIGTISIASGLGAVAGFAIGNGPGAVVGGAAGFQFGKEIATDVGTIICDRDNDSGSGGGGEKNNGNGNQHNEEEDDYPPEPEAVGEGEGCIINPDFLDKKSDPYSRLSLGRITVPLASGPGLNALVGRDTSGSARLVGLPASIASHANIKDLKTKDQLVSQNSDFGTSGSMTGGGHRSRMGFSGSDGGSGRLTRRRVDVDGLMAQSAGLPGGPPPPEGRPYLPGVSIDTQTTWVEISAPAEDGGPGETQTVPVEDTTVFIDPYSPLAIVFGAGEASPQVSQLILENPKLAQEIAKNIPMNWDPGRVDRQVGRSLGGR